jgi:hypothetical protein
MNTTVVQDVSDESARSEALGVACSARRDKKAGAQTHAPLTEFDLQHVGEPLEIIDLALEHGFDGKPYFVGAQFRAKACLSEGRLAGIYCSSHREHLGKVLEREEGIPGALLAKTMNEAKRRKRLFGEWLVERKLMTMARLRVCLSKHWAAHMRNLGLSCGAFELAMVEQRYRYDHSLTFSAHEILSNSVFDVASEPLSFAEALSVVNPFKREVVATHGDPNPELVGMLCDLAGRVERFSTDVALYPGPFVFRSDGRLYVVQPLRMHPRMSLTAAVCNPSKVGLLLQRATSLTDRI